jgi:protein-tyrosine phosphatase
MTGAANGVGCSRVLLAGEATNARDLGGLRTRDGGRVRRRLLTRAGSLVPLSVAAASRLSDELGVGCYVDLRTDREVRRDGAPLTLIEQGFAWRRVPLEEVDRAGPEDRSPRAYRDQYAVNAGRYVLAAVNVLQAVRSGPVVVACTLGKDRTGMVVAFALRALGVRPAEIAADFALSGRYLSRDVALLDERVRRKGVGMSDYLRGLFVPGGVCTGVVESTLRRAGLRSLVEDLTAAAAGVRELLVEPAAAAARPTG